eukprot:12393829-Karenia_brevis.AAC.1
MTWALSHTPCVHVCISLYNKHCFELRFLGIDKAFVAGVVAAASQPVLLEEQFWKQLIQRNHFDVHRCLR